MRSGSVRLACNDLSRAIGLLHLQAKITHPTTLNAPTSINIESRSRFPASLKKT
jgi:hypothetical protein